MQLKKYTDYALRVLIYSGMKNEGQLAKISEISDAFLISQNHLRKVVFELNKKGYLETVQGRNGGIRLAKLPEEMNVGEIVRQFEDDFMILECFDQSKNQCVISPACKLKNALSEAVEAFLHVLDDYTIKDLISNEGQLKKLMGID
ncbi:Rrf2 family transcriptional regulator [Virgibacillus sp. DJP39]|uniref:Rrf2 family transcriptional regulator n=1 Tax=Virgibacillus sp. DJP39 TaxID=3409790 RepID=UPI003BB68184